MSAPEVVITDWARSEAGRIVQQVEAEQASIRSARYATRREFAGAFVTQPLTAVREQPWYEPGSRTVAVDMAERPRLHRVARSAPKPPPAPLGAISAALVGGIDYPDPAELTAGLLPRSYAPVLQRIGASTGTRTDLEAESAWRLAIEGGAQ